MTSTGSARTLTVTGATGLLGRHLCDHFRRRGWEVRGLARDPSIYPFAECGVRLFRCDLPETIDQAALEGTDVVIHCAYMTRFTNMAEARRVNEDGTRRVLESSRMAGVRRFVFVSSIAAHPTAPNYYARSKYALQCLMDPAQDLVVRPGLILASDGGIFHRMMDSVRRMRVVPMLGGGGQIVQTVHVDDLCEAFERALARDLTGSVIVAEPEGLAMKELLQLMAAQLGRRCILIPFPNGPVLVILRLFEALGVRLPISSENLRGVTGLRHVPTAGDLERLGLRVRSAQESLATLPLWPRRSPWTCHRDLSEGVRERERQQGHPDKLK